MADETPADGVYLARRPACGCVVATLSLYRHETDKDDTYPGITAAIAALREAGLAVYLHATAPPALTKCPQQALPAAGG